MTNHGLEAQIDLAHLAHADLVDRGPHIVVNAPPRHATQDPKGLDVGIEQHLVSLQRIGPHDKGPAVRQFEVRDLQLRSLTAKDGPVLAPIELEGFAGFERQWHERTAAACLLLPQAAGFPVASEGGDAPIRARVAQHDEVFMQLFDRPLLLTRLP